MKRRHFMVGLSALAAGSLPASANTLSARNVVLEWYDLMLELVRHTATYTPPVASRSFAYLGVTLFEAVASGNPAMHSLAGQLNGLTAVPKRENGAAYDEAVMLQAAIAISATEFFSHTGPTGKRALKAMDRTTRDMVRQGVADDVIARSEAHGLAVARHVLDWSQNDGGAVVENLGFPTEFKFGTTPASWKPTGTVALQQKPLLPKWGDNRTFAIANGEACPLPPPPRYSEEPSSVFYQQALEVYKTVKFITDDQRAIARFWADDPMLSSTPPGHWIGIASALCKRDNLSVADTVDVLARVGIAVADGFIACWKCKFKFDLLRPVTYIRKVIDKKWETVLITPPFPEYPSGHSTQSGAAATVLTTFFGGNFQFTDETGTKDGLKPRTFASFHAAADEAGISRLYGGIHYRAAIEQGLEQGRCVGAHAASLKTKVS